MQVLKKIFNFMFSRLFLIGLMLLVQLVVIVSAVMYFSQTIFFVYLLFIVLSFCAVLFVVGNNENPSYKMTWIIAILAFPVIGWVFYLIFGNKRMPKKLKKRIDATLEDTQEHMPDNHLCQHQLLVSSDAHLALQGQYIYNIAGYPVMDNTAASYFPVGELLYEQMIKELKKAKKFIFLEFFIIQPGIMWDTIFAILKEKVAEGVEVYLMYDDLGSISTMPKGYNKIIKAAGIRLCVFNPFRPRVSVILNYRDHRKVVVVDGRVAFCGGVNLADEYINQCERFGHWKDTGVMLEGDAVWSFTFMFLQQWQFSTDEFIDFEKYKVTGNPQRSNGLIQPFGDSPLDKYNVTETAYLNIISRATKYVYITTPYLVIDNEMEVALCSAAQSGIDVRIITPYIYDKWFVHLLTRSHYCQLIKSGVKVYEYTPGFMHGKMFVSDDNVCMVGTCNMDFRSFYLHFECSVAFYHSDIVGQVKKDMLDCQRLSHLISAEESLIAPIYIRILRSVLKIFAPLM